MKPYLKLLFLFAAGGVLYNLLELFYRNWTHWTMFFLGGLCFVCLGLINEDIPWEMPLWQQMLIGAGIITSFEFITGCIVNLWLGWEIWDYSKIPGNILGQICPKFIVLWIWVALAGIVLDDWLRYWLFDEEKPHYKL
ncbi:MAG: hypothetical protein HFG49_11535 [Lachnospiraceae bacterium]|jgi:uncharacterized membrane protein|nr:hypothetical protein [Lachnospiraceae bacterium]